MKELEIKLPSYGYILIFLLVVTYLKFLNSKPEQGLAGFKLKVGNLRLM